MAPDDMGELLGLQMLENPAMWGKLDHSPTPLPQPIPGATTARHVRARRALPDP